MRIEGTCDFCGKTGDWEAGLFDPRDTALDRPEGWAAMFPWSRKSLPKGCTFDTKTLEKFKVETRFACPDCYRAGDLLDIRKKYVDEQEAYQRLRERKRKIEERLEAKKYPFWGDLIIRKIAETICKHLPDYQYEVMGPFGLGCEMPIHFIRKGTDRNKQYEEGKVLSITFRPGADMEKDASICIVDFRKNTGEFEKGTMGEVNGMNYKSIPFEWGKGEDWLMEQFWQQNQGKGSE